MKYTKFGELFRIYRIKNGETLHDAKDFLGVSTSFISAVELGKKKVPRKWLSIISDHYKLNDEERIEFEKAIDETMDSIKVDLSNTDLYQRNLAMVFSRSFDNISEETANEIIDILNGGNYNGLQNKEDIKK